MALRGGMVGCRDLWIRRNLPGIQASLCNLSFLGVRIPVGNVGFNVNDDKESKDGSKGMATGRSLHVSLQWVPGPNTGSRLRVLLSEAGHGLALGWHAGDIYSLSLIKFRET
jgi:hypothetical protein